MKLMTELNGLHFNCAFHAIAMHAPVISSYLFVNNLKIFLKKRHTSFKMRDCSKFSIFDNVLRKCEVLLSWFGRELEHVSVKNSVQIQWARHRDNAKGRTTRAAR